ncbi:MAG: carbohydrate ABC transporter permease [Oscillospiraceae bacterium]|nr:carbohydrate ABC transporter permease [Oscillospiraceae bacterium]
MGSDVRRKSKFRGNNVSPLADAGLHIICAILALACVIPFIFIVIISLTSAESLRTIGYSFFPSEWTLASFRAAFDMGDQLWRSFFNSMFVTVVGTSISVVMTVLYAYGLSRPDYPLKKFFAFFLFFTMVFGGGLVPTVFVVRNVLGLNNNFGALIVPALIVPFHVIIMRTFIKSAVPESLIESARMDGAGEFRTLFSIVVPIAKPGIATVSLLTAIGYWNDWFLALLFIRDRTLFPLQFLLMEMQQNIEFLRRNLSIIGSANIDFADLPGEGLRMALAVIIVVPIAFAYPFFQRYIISGLTVGAVKE